MPVITKPPVLKSFILHGKAGQKEREQAKEKDFNLELQNHEEKNNKISKKEALAENKRLKC